MSRIDRRFSKLTTLALDRANPVGEDWTSAVQVLAASNSLLRVYFRIDMLPLVADERTKKRIAKDAIRASKDADLAMHAIRLLAHGIAQSLRNESFRGDTNFRIGVLESVLEKYFPLSPDDIALLEEVGSDLDPLPDEFRRAWAIRVLSRLLRQDPFSYELPEYGDAKWDLMSRKLGFGSEAGLLRARGAETAVWDESCAMFLGHGFD